MSEDPYVNLTEEQKILSPIDRLMRYNKKAYSKRNPWGLGGEEPGKLFPAMCADTMASAEESAKKAVLIDTGKVIGPLL